MGVKTGPVLFSHNTMTAPGRTSPAYGRHCPGRAARGTIQAMERKRIAVAMSGGVDSSLCAAFLHEQGHRVVGLTMQIRDGQEKTLQDARQAAAFLGIEHHVIDLRSEFRAQVIGHFCREYCNGRTPNPCIRCNRQIKFGVLWQAAARSGVALMATGHYARLQRDNAGEPVRLHRGRDRTKDQSYFLYCLTQEQRARTLFPLGGYTKSDVRRMARERGLRGASGRESQDICFAVRGRYADLIEAEIPGAIRPGPVRDTGGTVLGRHRGLVHYTVGQRRGLGIAAPEPLYVVAIDTAENTLIVGTRNEIACVRLLAGDLHWANAAGSVPPRQVLAQIRYSHRAAAARLVFAPGGRVEVVFEQPQSAAAPGQAVVFYDDCDEMVLGGGTILR